MRSADIIEPPQFKGWSHTLPDFGPAKRAHEFAGVPFKRERVLCQFRCIEWNHYEPVNQAARDFVEMVSSLGWISEKRLTVAKRFVEIEITTNQGA